MLSAQHVSLVIPCYQPTGSWQELLRENLKAVRMQVQEVILVSDGNDDDTNTQLTTFAKEQEMLLVILQENKGKGAALREGIDFATTGFTLYTDFDFPYTQDSFQRVVYELQQGADVACGVRSAHYYKHLSPSRARLSMLFRWALRKLFSLPVDDTQCGLKGMNNRGKDVFLQTKTARYLFDLEFILLATRNGLSIAAAEVELRSNVQLSPMRIKVLLQESGNFLRLFIQQVFK